MISLNSKLYSSIWLISCIYAITIVYLGFTGNINGDVLDMNRNIVFVLAIFHTIYNWRRKK